MAGTAACTGDAGVPGACVSSDADGEWCVMTDPTMIMAMTAAAAIAIRRVVGRYHQGSNEPATAAMSVVNMAAGPGDGRRFAGGADAPASSSGAALIASPIASSGPSLITPATSAIAAGLLTRLGVW